MPQYQGVWTLEQQAQAQSNQQWVTDPNFKNTTLLLQADGTGSGSQNNTFLDGSTNNFFITRNGNTTQGSFSPFSQAPGYWSTYLYDGLIQASMGTNGQFGTGDFTVDIWVNPTSGSQTTSNVIWSFAAYPAGIYLSYDNDGNCYVYYASGSILTGGTGSLTFNTWNHVAVTRSGTSLRLFVNGVQRGSTATDSSNYTQGFYGLGRPNDVASYYFRGYISNFRVVKGTALYTTNFTPQTTPLTAVTNTQLLTLQSNRYVDNSTNNYAITTSGTYSVQAFSPFAPALQWTPDVVGGSGYFDGTTDYLAVADTTSLEPGTGDFCFETWVYHTSASNGSSFDTYTFQTSGGLFVYRNLSNKIQVDSDGVVAILTSASNVPFNSWAHIAVTRSGTTLRIFINGVVDASVTNSTNIAGSGNITYGGRSDGSILDGYMASTRFVKGSAVYTTTFTLPTTPLTAITNTQLLLNYTNAGIYDGKMANNLETVGNAQVATSPVKYGSGSMYFNGSTSYLRSQVTSPLFALGTSYTIEGWFYRLSNTSSGTYPNSLVLIGTQAIGVTCTGFFLTFNTGGVLNFYDGANATVISYASATTLIPLNQWNHIAIVRSGGGSNNVTLFVNGIAVSTGTSSSAQSTAQSFFIGGDTNGQGCFTGYMDDIRVTPGVARYFTTFTPPQQALPRQ